MLEQLAEQTGISKAALVIGCDSLAPGEIVVQAGIFQKSKLLRNRTVRRGKRVLFMGMGRQTVQIREKTRWIG